MSVLVVGSSGKTGIRVVQGLLARQTEVRAMVRRQEAAATLEALGAQSVLADLSYDVSYALSGCEAVIFTAGAGLSGNPELVDYRGTMRLIEAAEAQGVGRFILISSLGTGYAEKIPEPLRPYLAAKRKAEEALMASSLDYTIVKPGALTDAAGTGRLTLAEALERGGSIPRDDVAALVVELLLRNLGHRSSFEVTGGDTPLPDVLAMMQG